MSVEDVIRMWKSAPTWSTGSDVASPVGAVELSDTELAGVAGGTITLGVICTIVATNTPSTNDPGLTFSNACKPTAMCA